MPSSSLSELAESYEQSAEALRKRLRFLRQQVKEAEAQGKSTWYLKRRIAELTPMLTKVNKTIEVVTNYYEPGYYMAEEFRMYPTKFRTKSAYNPKDRLAETGDTEYGEPFG